MKNRNSKYQKILYNVSIVFVLLYILSNTTDVQAMYVSHPDQCPAGPADGWEFIDNCADGQNKYNLKNCDDPSNTTTLALDGRGSSTVYGGSNPGRGSNSVGYMIECDADLPPNQYQVLCSPSNTCRDGNRMTECPAGQWASEGTINVLEQCDDCRSGHVYCSAPWATPEDNKQNLDSNACNVNIGQTSWGREFSGRGQSDWDDPNLRNVAVSEECEPTMRSGWNLCKISNDDLINVDSLSDDEFNALVASEYEAREEGSGCTIDGKEGTIVGCLCVPNNAPFVHSEQNDGAVVETADGALVSSSTLLYDGGRDEFNFLNMDIVGAQKGFRLYINENDEICFTTRLGSTLCLQGQGGTDPGNPDEAQCGYGARWYPSETTDWPDSEPLYCINGNPSPSAPAFPDDDGAVTWDCELEDGSSISCWAGRGDNPPNPTVPVCGANSQVYSFEDTDYPGSDFCYQGNPSPSDPAFPNSGQTVNWECQHDGQSSYCSAFRESDNPGSGGAGYWKQDQGSDTIYYDEGNVNVRGDGDLDLWNDLLVDGCISLNGQRICDWQDAVTIDPVPPGPVDAQCGSASVTIFPEDATGWPADAEFCAPGIPFGGDPAFPGDVDDEFVTWTCSGTSGAPDPTCWAGYNDTTPPEEEFIGRCGTNHGSYSWDTEDFPGDDFCLSTTNDVSGVDFPANPGESSTWTCTGNMISATCSADRLPNPMNRAFIFDTQNEGEAREDGAILLGSDTSGNAGVDLLRLGTSDNTARMYIDGNNICFSLQDGSPVCLESSNNLEEATCGLYVGSYDNSQTDWPSIDGPGLCAKGTPDPESVEFPDEDEDVQWDCEVLDGSGNIQSSTTCWAGRGSANPPEGFPVCGEAHGIYPPGSSDLEGDLCMEGSSAIPSSVSLPVEGETATWECLDYYSTMCYAHHQQGTGGTNPGSGGGYWKQDDGSDHIYYDEGNVNVEGDGDLTVFGSIFAGTIRSSAYGASIRVAGDTVLEGNVVIDLS